MTKPKPIEEMDIHRAQRTWLGQGLRALLHCPWLLCEGSLRVVAHRPSTVRLECEQCGQRFSVPAAASYYRLQELHKDLSG